MDAPASKIISVAAEKLGLTNENKNNALVLCEVKSNGGLINFY